MSKRLDLCHEISSHNDFYSWSLQNVQNRSVPNEYFQEGHERGGMGFHDKVSIFFFKNIYFRAVVLYFNLCCRGITSNVTAVAIPIAITIFTTDILLSLKNKD